MPSRVLREGILTSERVNALDWESEVFYRRLMSVVDDFGRFTAHTSLVRAALYPLKLDTVRDADIERLLNAVEAAGLIRVYEVAQKRFLELLDFRQQTRAKDSKYPPPPEIAEQLPSTCAADAKQPCTDVHLGGGGGGDVFGVGDGYVSHPPPAREEQPSDPKAPFAMHSGWKPSVHIATLAKVAGLVLPDSPQLLAATGEFVAYWLTQPTRKRTQHEWDHSLVKSLKSDRIRGSPTAVAQRNGTPRRDRDAGRAAAAGTAFETPAAPQETAIDGTAERIA